MFTDLYRIWGGGLRIFCGFVPDLDEKAYGLFTGLTELGEKVYEFLPDLGEKVHGFVPDLDEKAYGLFTGLYPIWVRRLTDCLRIYIFLSLYK